MSDDDWGDDGIEDGGGWDTAKTNVYDDDEGFEEDWGEENTKTVENGNGNKQGKTLPCERLESILSEESMEQKKESLKKYIDELIRQQDIEGLKKLLQGTLHDIVQSNLETRNWAELFISHLSRFRPIFSSSFSS